MSTTYREARVAIPGLIKDSLSSEPLRLDHFFDYESYDARNISDDWDLWKPGRDVA